MMGPKKTIAMQYSPKNNVPYVSIVDGGTIELLKSLGYKIVSSADLVQMFVFRDSGRRLPNAHRGGAHHGQDPCGGLRQDP